MGELTGKSPRELKRVGGAAEERGDELSAAGEAAAGRGEHLAAAGLHARAAGQYVDAQRHYRAAADAYLARSTLLLKMAAVCSSIAAALLVLRAAGVL